VAEDGPHDVGIGDQGDDLHEAAASPARERVDLEDLPDEACPAATALPLEVGLLVLGEELLLGWEDILGAELQASSRHPAGSAGVGAVVLVGMPT
jgi:hypothetical protein